MQRDKVMPTHIEVTDLKGTLLFVPILSIGLLKLTSGRVGIYSINNDTSGRTYEIKESYEEVKAMILGECLPQSSIRESFVSKPITKDDVGLEVYCKDFEVGIIRGVAYPSEGVSSNYPVCVYFHSSDVERFFTLKGFFIHYSPSDSSNIRPLEI